MKNEQKVYTNRYNDVFTFTLDKDKNILWEGNFEYCRFGMPNDYSEAYKKYIEDNGSLNIDDFKSAIHEYSDKKGYTIDYKYRCLVNSIEHKIDMIDPSGGPYISVGSKLDSFGFKGYKVIDFEIIDTGYKIITNKTKLCIN